MKKMLVVSSWEKGRELFPSYPKRGWYDLVVVPQRIKIPDIFREIMKKAWGDKSPCAVVVIPEEGEWQKEIRRLLEAYEFDILCGWDESCPQKIRKKYPLSAVISAEDVACLKGQAYDFYHDGKNHIIYHEESRGWAPIWYDFGELCLQSRADTKNFRISIEKKGKPEREPSFGKNTSERKRLKIVLTGTNEPVNAKLGCYSNSRPHYEELWGRDIRSANHKGALIFGAASYGCYYAVNFVFDNGIEVPYIKRK